MGSGSNEKLDIEQLFERYSGLVFHKCLRILGDRHEAEDAVQETFVQAFRAPHSFRYGDTPLPWLYRIATNACLKILRTKRRKGVALMPDAERAPAAVSSDATIDVLDARRLLTRFMDSLDERSLEILVACYSDGMTQEQAAEALGISRRTVVTRLQRIREQIAQDPALGRKA